MTKKSPSHKLTHEEEQTILKELNSARFIDKTPREIVPLLADENIYLASESTFYRVLKKHNLLTHRSRARSRKPRPVPTLKAIAPNQVWSWVRLDKHRLNRRVKFPLSKGVYHAVASIA